MVWWYFTERRLIANSRVLLSDPGLKGMAWWCSTARRWVTLARAMHAPLLGMVWWCSTAKRWVSLARVMHTHTHTQVGLLLVDRNTVVIGPCDVNISFGAHPCEATGTVRCVRQPCFIVRV